MNGRYSSFIIVFKEKLYSQIILPFIYKTQFTVIYNAISITSIKFVEINEENVNKRTLLQVMLF